MKTSESKVDRIYEINVKAGLGLAIALFILSLIIIAIR